MAKPVVLEKSQVVMTWNAMDGYWSAPNGAELASPDRSVQFSVRPTWYASIPSGYSKVGTRKACEAWLDQQMLAAQKVVLPPEGFVVVDDEASVDRIVRTIVDQSARRGVFGHGRKVASVVAARSLARAIMAELKERTK